MVDHHFITVSMPIIRCVSVASIWVIVLLLLCCMGCGTSETTDQSPQLQQPSGRDSSGGGTAEPLSLPSSPVDRFALNGQETKPQRPSTKDSPQEPGKTGYRDATPGGLKTGDSLTNRGNQAADPFAKDDDGCLPKRRLGPLELVRLDAETIAAAGLKQTESPHLLLITDHPEIESFTDFHSVIEQAIPQWVDFFGADPRRFAGWKLTCFLIVDEAKFRQAELLPGPGHLAAGKIPPGGWQYGNQVWVRHQPGSYYTRHMLLHEATHAFAGFNFGALGAPWLAEGLAEYLAVHRWNGERLELAARVVSKDELPYWGRVKLIRDAYHSGTPKTLLEVIQFPPSAFPRTDSYAWSWAAVSLFAGHPKLRPHFLSHLRRLGSMSDNQWNRELVNNLPLTKEQLETQWQVDTLFIQYGHDFQRSAIVWSDAPQAIRSDSETKIVIPADGAWHSSGLKLPTGQWRLTATGQYVVTTDDAGDWVAGPEGITIRYVHGAPLGLLQYAACGERPILAGMSELTKPQSLGNHVVLNSTGEELFLRINDAANQLEDNTGSVEVTIQRVMD